MSAPAVKRTIYDDAVDRELTMWPGVTASREVRSKHLALVLTYNGQSRFCMYPMSPSDSYRGALNHLTNVRATLRELGAQRVQPSKRQRQERRRLRANDRREIAIKPVERGEGPTRDPWEALRGLDIAFAEVQPAEYMPEAQTVPPAKSSLWRRVLARIRSLFT